jgi:hypothetical protein
MISLVKRPFLCPSDSLSIVNVLILLFIICKEDLLFVHLHIIPIVRSVISDPLARMSSDTPS